LYLFAASLKLRADAVLQRKLDSLPNVTVITSAQTTEVPGARAGLRTCCLLGRPRTATLPFCG
jgi:alkyl hydroperoxide reductase subunit AhpF